MLPDINELQKQTIIVRALRAGFFLVAILYSLAFMAPSTSSNIPGMQA